MKKKPVKRFPWQKWVLSVQAILFLSAFPLLTEYRDTGSVETSSVVNTVVIFSVALIIAVSASRKGKKK